MKVADLFNQNGKTKQSLFEVWILALLFVCFPDPGASASNDGIYIRRVQRTELIERLFCAQSEGAAAVLAGFLSDDGQLEA